MLLYYCQSWTDMSNNLNITSVFAVPRLKNKHKEIHFPFKMLQWRNKITFLGPHVSVIHITSRPAPYLTLLVLFWKLAILSQWWGWASCQVQIEEPSFQWTSNSPKTADVIIFLYVPQSDYHDFICMWVGGWWHVGVQIGGVVDMGFPFNRTPNSIQYMLCIKSCNKQIQIEYQSSWTPFVLIDKEI